MSIYSQFMKLWRSENECPLILLISKYPIIDEILVCALRTVAVVCGLQQAKDFNTKVELEDVLPLIKSKLNFPHEILIFWRGSLALKVTLTQD